MHSLARSLSPWRDSVYFERDKSQHKHSDTEGEVLCRRRRRGCRVDRGLGRLGWGYKSGGSTEEEEEEGVLLMKSPLDSYIKRAG